jgi:hypothetical protein
MVVVIEKETHADFIDKNIWRKEIPAGKIDRNFQNVLF